MFSRLFGKNSSKFPHRSTRSRNNSRLIRGGNKKKIYKTFRKKRNAKSSKRYHNKQTRRDRRVRK